MKSQVWQAIAGALASALVTGAGCWLAFGHDRVSRSEMESHVQNQAPWVKERGKIHVSIERNHDTIVKLEQAVANLIKAQHALIVEQRVLVTKVDQLITKQED